MTLERANKIIEVWGVYLENFQGKLMYVFGGHIPKSFLPVLPEDLEEAINIIAEHHFNLNNREAEKSLKDSIGWLSAYGDDEESIIQTEKLFNDPEWRKVTIPAFRKYQNKWAEEHKILTDE